VQNPALALHTELVAAGTETAHDRGRLSLSDPLVVVIDGDVDAGLGDMHHGFAPGGTGVLGDLPEEGPTQE
jgi:hypothetical protein